MPSLFATPPTPPSPIATAGAQTATNIGTGVANAWLNNTNQVTPTGSLTYDQTGTHTYNDPLTGAAYDIPRFTATQTLSPQEQEILNKTEGAKVNLADLAQTQSGRLNALLGHDLDLSGAPAAGAASDISGIPAAATTFGDNTDYNLARSHVEDALTKRLQPQQDRSRNQLEQRLADQGIRYGSPAYASAMDDYNRGLTDQRLAVTQAGAAEQQQAYTQDLGRGTFKNAALQQQVSAAQAKVNAANTARQNYLTEAYAKRNQPVNEITALLSGSQVSRPNFVNTPSTNIPATDVAGLMNTNFAQQSANYNQQAANTNSLIGGLFGFGGNLVRNPSFTASDKRVKKNIHRIGTVLAATPQKVQEPDNKELPIYSYAYKNDPSSTQHIGPMAQDVEKIDRGAVRSFGGVKHIDAGRVMGSIMRAA